MPANACATSSAPTAWSFSISGRASAVTCKPPRPAVVGIAAPLDQAGFLEPVDDPAQCDRLEIEHVGKLDLPKARRAGQSEQHLPLGARDPEPDREAIERLAQGMRRLADLEGKCFHNVIIIRVLILGNALNTQNASRHAKFRAALSPR